MKNSCLISKQNAVVLPTKSWMRQLTLNELSNASDLISRNIKIQQTRKNLLYIILNLTSTWNQSKTSPKCPALGRIREVVKMSQLFLKQNFSAAVWWQVCLKNSQHADYAKTITLQCHFLEQTRKAIQTIKQNNTNGLVTEFGEAVIL